MSVRDADLESSEVQNAIYKFIGSATAQAEYAAREQVRETAERVKEDGRLSDRIDALRAEVAAIRADRAREVGERDGAVKANAAGRANLLFLFQVVGGLTVLAGFAIGAWKLAALVAGAP